MVYSAPGWLPETIMTHGGHSYMNLFEGNIMPNFYFDDIHGSGSHNVIFRNRAFGWQADRNGTNSAIPIQYEYWNKYQSAIGNVLGKQGFHTSYGSIYSVDKLPQSGTFNGTTVTMEPLSSSNEGASTLIRWANWDTGTNGVRYNTSELPSGMSTPSQTLPTSLYLSAKPAFFGASTLAWPSIEPTAATLSNSDTFFTNPAKYCYDQGKMPGCLLP